MKDVASVALIAAMTSTWAVTNQENLRPQANLLIFRASALSVAASATGVPIDSAVLVPDRAPPVSADRQAAA